MHFSVRSGSGLLNVGMASAPFLNTASSKICIVMSYWKVMSYPSPVSVFHLHTLSLKMKPLKFEYTHHVVCPQLNRLCLLVFQCVMQDVNG